jgi:hypothetical protein
VAIRTTKAPLRGKLEDVSFTGSITRGLALRRVAVDGLDLGFGEVRGISFDEVRGRSIGFNQGPVEGARFTRCEIAGVAFGGARVSGLVIERCPMIAMLAMEDSEVSGLNVSDSTLRMASFSKCRVAGANVFDRVTFEALGLGSSTMTGLVIRRSTLDGPLEAEKARIVEIATMDTPGDGEIMAGGRSGFLFSEHAGPLWHFPADGAGRRRLLAECDGVAGRVVRSLGADESGFYFLVSGMVDEVVRVSPASGCRRVSVWKVAGGQRTGWKGPDVTITGLAALLVYWRPSEVEDEFERLGYLVPDVRALFRDDASAGEAFELPSRGGFQVLATWTSADGRPGLLLGGESLSAWSPAGGERRLSRRRDPETVLEWLSKQPVTLVQFLTGVER